MKLFGIAYENKVLYFGLFLINFEITINNKNNKIQYTKLNDDDIDFCWQHCSGNTEWAKRKAFAYSLLKKASEK